MKKLLFFALFICFASFVNAQNSQSVGLKFSYLSHNTNTPLLGWHEWSKSPEVGFVYNYFLTEKHGLVITTSVNRTQTKLDNIIGASFNSIKIINYHSSISLHYIFKYKQWFAKGGLNGNFANVAHYSYTDDVLSLRMLFDKDIIRPMSELHLGLGRDFDLGKINLRLNGFVEKGFLNGDYMQYGATLGVFYELGK